MTALPLHQRFETRIVDLDAGTQQQILDGDRRQPRRIAALQRRQAADDQPKPARPHQHGFGMRLRIERRRRHHHARDRLVAPGEIADHVLDVVDPAKHRNIADRLAAIGHRWRQHADRPQPRDRAAFDPAQQHLGIGGAADQQRRRRAVGAGMTANARVAEITIGKAQRAQEEHLEEPVENDGDLAERRSVP